MDDLPMSEKSNQLEHRCDRRVAIGLPVTLYSRMNPPVLAQVRNLGRGGALIAADAGLFPRYTMLYLDLRGPHRSGQEAIIPALVIHNGERGLGVMFTDELPDIIFDYAIGREPSQSPIPAAA